MTAPHDPDEPVVTDDHEQGRDHAGGLPDAETPPPALVQRVKDAYRRRVPPLPAPRPPTD